MRRLLLLCTLVVPLLDGCASVVSPDGSRGEDARLETAVSVDAGSDARVIDGIGPVDVFTTEVVPFRDTGPMRDVLPFEDWTFIDVPPARDVPPAFDVPPRLDVPPARDVPPGTDVQPPRDVPPARDVPPGTDVPPIRDVPPGVDVVIPTDVPPGFDAGMLPITGRWRAIAWDFPGDAGLTHIIDTNTTVTVGGVSYDVRVNGVLLLSDNRMSETFGILLNDHFYSDDNNPDYAAATSTFGFGAPGVLAGNTFNIVGGTTVRFGRNADGTITQIDISNGSAITWARLDTWPVTSMIGVVGQAHLYRAAMSGAFTAPRVTLAWDRPGFAGGYTYTNDQPIAFGPFGTARYPISVTAPPADAIGTVGTALVAVAYILVYDDRNGNGAYDGLGSTDILRGLSPIGIGYRAGAGSMALDRSSFRDLQPGLQMVHIHPDYSITREGAGPWDPTLPVPPDVVVNTARDTRAVPDLLP